MKQVGSSVASWDTVSEVWTPAGELRDETGITADADLPGAAPHAVQDRIDATMARHNVSLAIADPFSAALQLAPHLAELPVYSREVVQQELGYWIRWTSRSNPQNSGWKLF
jgi:hypothetical protein